VVLIRRLPLENQHISILSVAGFEMQSLSEQRHLNLLYAPSGITLWVTGYRAFCFLIMRGTQATFEGQSAASHGYAGLSGKTRCEYIPVRSTAASLPQTVLPDRLA
jgi:hypothetical protein